MRRGLALIGFETTLRLEAPAEGRFGEIAGEARHDTAGEIRPMPCESMPNTPTNAVY